MVGLTPQLSSELPQCYNELAPPYWVVAPLFHQPPGAGTGVIRTADNGGNVPMNGLTVLLGDFYTSFFENLGHVSQVAAHLWPAPLDGTACYASLQPA